MKPTLAVSAGDSLDTARHKLRTLISTGFSKRNAPADAALDARILLTHVLKLSHTDLITDTDRQLSAVEATTITALGQQRGQGVPVARLVGETEFWSLPFFISEETLIPRPDSERLVEAALENLRDDATSILDVGTGTGCLALAILSERTDIKALGLDISMDALETASRNAQRLGVVDRFSTRQSNLFEAIGKGARFDLILSNPPYIASNVIETLEPEVRDHDPRVALDGGPDGLGIYRRLIADAGDFLAPGAPLILEIGYDQDASVADIMTAEGFQTEVLFDLADQPRVLVGHKIATKIGKKSV